MPATTRSAKQQSTLEDVGAGNVDSKGSNTTSKKRKAPVEQQDAQSSVKRKKGLDSGDNSGDHNSNASVTINRAPVLELWASCVTQLLYPLLSWNTCLSTGGAISTITAISKGRSIGKIEKPSPEEAQNKREERQQQAADGQLEELETMSFKLSLNQSGQAMAAGKPKKANEGALTKKYGGSEEYERVKRTFNEALQAWKGSEDQLSERAFGMYEDFRPSVPPGQSGWGRKGQLNLETVKSAVSNK